LKKGFGPLPVPPLKGRKRFLQGPVVISKAFLIWKATPSPPTSGKVGKGSNRRGPERGQ